MYLGKIVEVGTVEQLYHDPRHPYTVALLSAIPEREPAPPQVAARAQGRRAVARGAAVGLPVPHPLLAARAARQPRELLDRSSRRCGRSGRRATRSPATGPRTSARRRWPRPPRRPRRSSRRPPTTSDPSPRPAGRARLATVAGRHRRRDPGRRAPRRRVRRRRLVAAPQPAPRRPPSPAASGRRRAPVGRARAPQPSATPWPGGVVEAVRRPRRKADQEIQTAGADLGTAATNQDLEAMWGAADGLATLLEQLPAQVDRIRGLPGRWRRSRPPTTRPCPTCSRRHGAPRLDHRRATPPAITAGSQQLAERPRGLRGGPRRSSARSSTRRS